MSTVFLGSTKHISLWHTFIDAIPSSGKAGMDTWPPVSAGAKVNCGALDWRHAALRVCFVRVLYPAIVRGL